MSVEKIRKCTISKLLAAVFLTAWVFLGLAGPARAGSQVLWGMGDNFAGATNSPLFNDEPIKMVTHWYNGPGDLSWIRGYKNTNTVSNYYGNGYGIELVIWLANDPTYATSAQFQTDLAELVSIFKGQGPNYGPLYVVMFTEFSTYGNSTYMSSLRTAYMNSIATVHSTYSKAYVGLGFGGYAWSTGSTSVDLSFWDSAIRASDFVPVQAMQDYNHVSELIAQVKASVQQLGTYKLPVMISHFKIWANDGNHAGVEAAFNTFMDAIFTDAQMDTLVSQGLFAWGWMDDYYIKSADATYDRAKWFIDQHNENDPYPRRECEFASAYSPDVYLTNYAEYGPSQGKYMYAPTNAVGQIVKVTVPVSKIGTYAVKVRVKKRSNRGQFQLAIGGANQGTVQDCYSLNDAYSVLSLGNKTFNATGDKEFKFTITGKLSSSTDYTLALDYIQLIPQ